MSPPVFTFTPPGRLLIQNAALPVDVRVDAAQVCYANCDSSITAPAMNTADFSCFLQRFAEGSPYANCDGSSTIPVLNVNDFSCFLQAFASCSVDPIVDGTRLAPWPEPVRVIRGMGIGGWMEGTPPVYQVLVCPDSSGTIELEVVKLRGNVSGHALDMPASAASTLSLDFSIDLPDFRDPVATLAPAGGASADSPEALLFLEDQPPPLPGPVRPDYLLTVGAMVLLAGGAVWFRLRRAR